MKFAIGAVLLASMAAPVTAGLADGPVVANPEARPFGSPDSARADVAAALVRAKANGHRIILIFGANWCHDSRALAGWFATPRFAAMLATRYELVWIDVGMKDRNVDLARSFGLKGIAGTPTVLVVNATGTPLNLDDAPAWRNASTRKADAIFSYFEQGSFSGGAK